MSAIRAENISKNFGDVQAVRQASFEVEEGELFGFIGPDGAGKTTLFRVLTTLLLPDEGQATVAGIDILDYKPLRKILGYMPGRFSLYQDLTVEENLNFFATIFGTTVEENYELVKDIYSHLEPFKKRKAKDLSGGMKQKLALSCALIHHPTLLVLDEPTTGVDAISRKEFWEMLKDLQQRGITIIVSTPYMDEADLCDRVALMQNGRIMDIDTPQGVVDGFHRTLLNIHSHSIAQLLNDLEHYADTLRVYPFGSSVHYIDRGEPDEQAIADFLKAKGHGQLTIEQGQPDIEDCFLALMEGDYE